MVHPNSWRNSRKYKVWQQAVLKQGDYKCSKCDDQENLVCDHIKSGAIFHRFRYTVSNGRVLCRKCHSKYGSRTYTLVPQIKSLSKNSRRIITFGHTYVITIPNDWVKERNLKKGDKMVCVCDGKSLLYYPIDSVTGVVSQSGIRYYADPNFPGSLIYDFEGKKFKETEDLRKTGASS